MSDRCFHWQLPCLNTIGHDAGETRSEGGFAKNKVQSASLLDASVAKDKNGKSYYK